MVRFGFTAAHSRKEALADVISNQETRYPVHLKHKP